MLYQSARYQLIDANQEIEQNQDDVQALSDKLDRETAERKAFNEILAFENSKKERIAFLKGIGHGIYRAPNSTSGTHAIALSALTEVNDLMGKISGYHSLPAEFREALVNDLTAEANVWEVIREHTVSSRNRQRDQLAGEELYLATVQWTRADSAAGSVLKEEILRQTNQDNSRHQLNRTRQRLEQLKSRLHMARQAFPVALFVWIMLLVYLVRPAGNKYKEERTPNFE
jgi:hypothetical protein